MTDPAEQKIEVTVHRLPAFDVLYEPPPETNLIILIGGRGGAKTYEVSKFLAFSACIRRKRCAVLRDEKETIRESILNDILARYDTANIEGVLDSNYEKLDTGIRDRQTKEMLIFTKGFRASDSKKTANLKSISNVDVAVIEEAEDIRDMQKYNTFADSIRKEGSLIIIILNTPDVGHWVIKTYFNIFAIEPPEDATEQEIKEYDGYFRIEPKSIPGFVCIHTSFTDNPHLPQHIIDKYNGYGIKGHHLYNLHYYLTAIKGYASHGRKGQILRKVKPIKLAEYMAINVPEIIGQDFGTARPAATVGVKFYKNKCYCREINYLPMETIQIGKMYCKMKLLPSDKIVADHADKKAWQTLRDGWKTNELTVEDIRQYPGLITGWFVVPCRKGVDSVTTGVDTMIGMDLYAVEEHVNLWFEITNYMYGQDKYGNYTNEPEDNNNHLIDAWRYVINDRNRHDAQAETQ